MNGNKKAKRIGVLVGPTASGKTALSVALAKAMHAEIVSADSIQIYREMDVGSAKPSPQEQQGVPHHMLDLLRPDTPDFSVAAYQKMAFSAIDGILRRGHFPLVTGGTGLYINALTFPLQFTGIPSNAAIRSRLEREEGERPGCLYERLRRLDAESAARLHPNDKKRIVRALEVYELSGRPIGDFGRDFANKAGLPGPYTARMLGLTMPREMLYARINTRVDAMMEAGLLEETEALLAKGYAETLPAMQGLGYKQLIQYLHGACTLEEAVETIKRETRRFAKRQLTWFKRDTRICWLDVSSMPFDALVESARTYLEKEEAEQGG